MVSLEKMPPSRVRLTRPSGSSTLGSEKYIPGDARPMVDTMTLFPRSLGSGQWHPSEANAIVAVRMAEWTRQIDLARDKPVTHTGRLMPDNERGFLDPLPKSLSTTRRR